MIVLGQDVAADNLRKLAQAMQESRARRQAEIPQGPTVALAEGTPMQQQTISDTWTPEQNALWNYGGPNRDVGVLQLQQLAAGMDTGQGGSKSRRQDTMHQRTISDTWSPAENAAFGK